MFFHLARWLPANALVRSPTKTRRKYEAEMKKINLFFIKSKGVFDLIGFFVRLSDSGIKTNLLFCVQHTAIESVQVAEHIDPTYAESVKIAANAGVTVLAASCIIDEQKILLNQTLPLIL